MCHKSVLNFCTIINSLSVFHQNKTYENTSNERKLDNTILKEELLPSTYFNEELKVNIKEEITFTPSEVKEEIQEDNKYENLPYSISEGIDLKMDIVEEPKIEK